MRGGEEGEERIERKSKGERRLINTNKSVLIPTRVY